MVVQHNLTAMNSNRMLGLTTKAQAKSTEKLSSGYKINRAADDAAGLAISEKMRRQVRGLTQASANAQDGISAVQTAEGALTEVHDMLQRMNELATKSANGTNSQEERDYIQSEVDALIDEIDRVSETTKFNEIYLLKGAQDSNGTPVETPAVKQTVAMNDAAKKLMEMQITVKAGQSAYGVGEIDAVTADTGATAAEAAKMAINTTALGAGNKFWGSTDGGTTYNEIAAEADLATYFDVADDGTVTAKANTAFKTAADTVNQAGINGGAGTAVADGTTLVTGTPKKDAADATPGTLDKYVELDEDGNLKYKDGAMLYKVPADKDGEHGDQVVHDTANQIAETDLGTYFEAKGTPIRTGNTTTSAALAEDADMSTYFDEYGVYLGGLYLEDTNGAMKEIGAEQVDKYFTFTPAEGENGASAAGSALEFSLHVGAEGGAMTDEKAISNKITVKIEAMSAAGIGIDGLRSQTGDDGKNTGGGVRTEADATASIETIKAAIKKVSQQRSDLGAVQNRLEHTINNLDNIVENTQSAESAIRDTDMATEMVKYANNNILAQAGQAMLAQANQANQGVLSLLG